MSDLLKAVALSRLPHTTEIRQIASPAAGADITIPVGNGEAWRLLGLKATVVTDANVAARIPHLALDNGTATIIGAQISPGASFPAGSTVTLSWVSSYAAGVTVVAGGVVTVGVPDFVIPTGWRLRTITTAIQVGDQWSNITAFIERLDEPPWREPMIGTAFDDAVHEALAQSEQGMMQ